MTGPGRPPFVVLEGGEGVGKSTQLVLLSAWLRELGVDHVSAREPGGTAVGEAIREILLRRSELTFGAETEMLLMVAARAAFVAEVVLPALESGRVVLADRFDLSTLVYQGLARGLDLDEIRGVNRVATRGVVPDLYLVIDLPVSLGLERREASGRGPDRIESEGTTFLERVREGYLALVESEPRARLVDGRGSVEEVQMRLREALSRRFPGTFPGASG